MDMIITPNNDMFDSLRDNPDARYAAKHSVESGIMLQGIVQFDHYRPMRNLRPGDGFVLDEFGNPMFHPRTGFPMISGGYPEPPNTFTTQGMAYLLNIIFFTTSKAASLIWYVGTFKNNVTPAVGDTAALALGAAGTYLECQDADYDSPATSKPSYTTATTAIATITNAVAGKAEYVWKASITVYGAFLSTVAAKTATTGYLMCAKKLTNARVVIDDDESAITYIITLTTS